MIDSTIFYYLWRFIVGGGAIVIISYLSRTGRPILAGIAIFFPTITIISYALIGYSEGLSEIRRSIPASVIAMVGYFVFFPVMYYSTYYFNIYGVIFISLASWSTVVSFIAWINPLSVF